MKAALVTLALAFGAGALGTGSKVRRGRAPVLETRQSRPSSYPIHTFDQLIDHFPNSTDYAPHPGNATFKQRYVFDSSYYKPGGPVFLYISGETSAESRFSNLETGIIQILMQATNGLGVILENRYYGGSFPVNESTTDDLRFLTTEQTIADNANFAQHAVFPGINQTLTAPNTPWILYGGSLAGSQTAFSIKTYGDILWAGIASSGTTKAKHTYVEWYDPIQKFGPQDCVGSINALVDKIDYVLEYGTPSAVNKLKSLFGLERLTDDRDFAMTIAYPLGGPMFYPTNTWQELNWNESYSSNDFFLFCSNVTNPDSPHNITQLDYVLANYTHGEAWPNLGNYATYVKNHIAPICFAPDAEGWECNIGGEKYWSNTTNDNNRSYLYSTCIESGIFQAARKYGPTLLSRVVQADYTQEWCRQAFPPGKYNKIPEEPEIWKNNKYGGYNVVADRLAHIDGNQDVWLDICYHSNDVEERVTRSVEEAYLRPQLLITGAGHHWDSYGILDVDAEPLFIREAHKWEIRIVKQWLKMFEEKKGNGTVKGY